MKRNNVREPRKVGCRPPGGNASPPLPLGEGWGEGNPFTWFLPPHPNPLPQGGEGTLFWSAIADGTARRSMPYLFVANAIARWSIAYLPIALFLLTLSLPEAQAQMVPILEGVFKVENDQSVEKTERIATIEYKPSSSIYVVRGRVQYSDVEGAAYLEMWNVMPDGSRYFSRTLGEYGTMQKIQGSNGWRKFELPFNLMKHKPESVTLEINVVMPGKGTIELSDLTVSDLQTSVAGEWFDGRTAGMIGAWGGCFWGLYGALFGILNGLLASRGKGRRFLTAMCIFPIPIGIICGVVGITTLLCGQPYHVWYGFILSAAVLLFVFPTVYFGAVRPVYEQAEQRKMQALDA